MLARSPVIVWLCGLLPMLLVTGAGQGRDLGAVSFPTSGPAAAQALFLRGVLNLHNFEYEEAIAAFREAERMAPAFVMAYWGEALSYSQPLWQHEDVVKAREALTRLGPTPGARAAKAATPRERGYLEAVERLFGGGDRITRQRAYAERMALLHRDFPQDDEAAVLYALALLATIPEAAADADVSLRAGSLAMAVLDRNPRHPGAAHYALHAFDDGEHNARGLEAARQYAKIAPASSHALHMPAHVFLPLGMWDEAAAADEAAFAASVAWAGRTGRGPEQHDFHSLSWLHYEYLQQGRFEKARAAEATVRATLEQTPGGGAGPLGAGAAHHAGSEIGRGFDRASLRNELASMRARFVIEAGDWEQLKGSSSFDNLDELFALGLSSIALADLGRADAALGHLKQAAESMSDRDARDVASIMADQLGGLAAIARGRGPDGLAALARAAAREQARPRPVARPYPVKPATEMYGEALVALGEPRAAVTEFQRALVRTPHRAMALIGLARAAHAAGDGQAAARAARELLQVWHRADADRPELAEARELAGLTSRRR